MQRYMRISIGENQTTIRDGTNYVATVHGNCDHVSIATLFAAAPDLLAACEIALHVLDQVTWDSETEKGRQVAKLYDLLPKVIERSKNNLIHVDFKQF